MTRDQLDYYENELLPKLSPDNQQVLREIASALRHEWDKESRLWSAIRFAADLWYPKLHEGVKHFYEQQQEVGK